MPSLTERMLKKIERRLQKPDRSAHEIEALKALRDELINDASADLVDIAYCLSEIDKSYRRRFHWSYPRQT